MVPRRELSIRNKKGLKRESGPIDPALWNCVCLYELRLELADGALTSLPPQVSRLHDLTTLILSGNALASLPEEVGELRKLKNFEAAANGLTALPASFSKLEQLQKMIAEWRAAVVAKKGTVSGLVPTHFSSSSFSRPQKMTTP